MAFLPEIAEVAEAGAAETAESGAAEELDDGAPSGEHNLGNGNSMHLSEEQFRALLHSSAAVAGVMDRAEKCAEIANSLAITKGAKYAVHLQNEADHTRARAAVYAANFKAVVDTMFHSTMLKAAAQTGSDPRQTPGAEEHGAEPERPEGASAEASASEGAELAQEALPEI